MTLRLYNTLTRKKEDFVPLDPANVRMYVCGPTVYDFAHIGNARPVIVFDVLFRLLRHLYGESHVTYVRNITDVDDKINARALLDHPDLPLNEAIRRVTETTANQFQKDVKALGCLPPTHEPRATDNIPQMIEMISTLLMRGHAYETGGEVLFDVTSMAEYGALSHRHLDEQQAGARVAVEAHKKNPADFVLWKLSSAEEPGWDSPWGRGRPGWHIECSAMSKRYLGQIFDIHGGGLDLIFPHHENELAQSRCAHGTDVMANIWMHNGFLQVEGQKMSKSLGNFVTISDELKYRIGESLRLSMLMTNYTQPINWTNDRLNEALDWLQTWYRSMPNQTIASEPFQEVVDALSDDLNTWEALKFLNGVLAERRKHTQYPNAKDEWLLWKAARFKASANLLGFMFRTFEEFHAEVVARQMAYELDTLPGTRESIQAMVDARDAARKAKNWAESDRIRDELAVMGIAIEDSKDGKASWKVKR